MNIENVKENNTDEIEFPNARGVVNHLHYHDYHDSLSLSMPSSALSAKAHHP